jgi:MoaA/NifB/PqqE/SkfB family radical SAM enzyme
MHAIDLFRRVGLEPKILVTVTRHTLSNLESLLCLLILQGLTRININRFRPVGRGSDRPDWCVSEPEVAAAIDRAWRRLHPRNSMPPARPTVDSQQTCGVGRFLNIMPNGDVFPCHVLTHPEFRCGNLRTEDLSTICARHGLLGRLAGLDLRRLKQVDPGLAVLTVMGVCMGEVYAQQKTSPAWSSVVGAPRTCDSVSRVGRDGDDSKEIASRSGLTSR